MLFPLRAVTAFDQVYRLLPIEDTQASAVIDTQRVDQGAEQGFRPPAQRPEPAAPPPLARTRWSVLWLAQARGRSPPPGQLQHHQQQAAETEVGTGAASHAAGAGGGTCVLKVRGAGALWCSMRAAACSLRLSLQGLRMGMP